MTTTQPSTAQKLTLVTMTGMVVGGMVGAGVFSLPRRFAQAGELVILAVSVIGQ